MKLLHVTPSLIGSGVGGRQQLSRVYSNLLERICTGGYERIELLGRAGMGRFFGYIDGINNKTILDVFRRINILEPTHVFLDGSNLGKLAESIKRSYPSLEIIIFFHNCEARFFLGSLRRTKSLRALAVLFSNYLAEKSAVKYSDKRICLSNRDSEQLNKIYGNGATHISAMAMLDRFSPNRLSYSGIPSEKYALFVGGAFYANVAGIEWYSREVAPRVAMHTYVVGKGMSEIKVSLEQYGNITVIGEVEDLSAWYLGAHVVVAPVFDGSGMKTKVAEALMYGKKVIGTPEAFSGYDEVVVQSGWVCRNDIEFLQAVDASSKENKESFNSSLRKLYERFYSLEAAQDRLERILG